MSPQRSHVPPVLSRSGDPSPLAAFRRLGNDQERLREESARQQDATVASGADPEPNSIAASTHPTALPSPGGHGGLTAPRLSNRPPRLPRHEEPRHGHGAKLSDADCPLTNHLARIINGNLVSAGFISKIPEYPTRSRRLLLCQQPGDRVAGGGERGTSLLRTPTIFLKLNPSLLSAPTPQHPPAAGRPVPLQSGRVYKLPAAAPSFPLAPTWGTSTPRNTLGEASSEKHPWRSILGITGMGRRRERTRRERSPWQTKLAPAGDAFPTTAANWFPSTSPAPALGSGRGRGRHVTPPSSVLIFSFPFLGG